jgi:outer membrane protein assembly factor BamB
MTRLTCLGIGFLLWMTTARAEEWPGWRGSRGDGTSTEIGLPLHWSAGDNVAWKAAIPGIGHSSPIVWGDRTFVTTCLEKDFQRLLLCLDRRNGKLLWQRVVVTSKLEGKHKLNSYASSTPVTDGKHVWVTFLQEHDIEVACYDFDGNLVWRRSPGQFFSVHGFCSSPVLYHDLLIVNGDQDAEAYLVALDKNTGAERWRADRPNRTRSYCAPLLVNAAGKPQLVLSGSKCVASYDPDTGKQYWIIDGPTEQYVASLVHTDGVLFLTAGFPEYHNMGIRPDGVGNVTRTHVLWHEKKTTARKAAYVPSPIAHGHHFYVMSDLGYLSCFEARTGKRLWMEKLGRHHSASPAAAEGRLYCVDDDGITHIVKAGPTFEVLSRNALGDACYASPAIARGQIFIRTLHDLYCIGDAGKIHAGGR